MIKTHRQIGDLFNRLLNKSCIGTAVLCAGLFLASPSMMATTDKNVDKNSESLSPLQKTHSVKVTVTDGTEPLIGASVIVKGTTDGGTTDVDGVYTFRNVAENATIVITYVGFHPQEYILNGESAINIILSEDAGLLDEVVVIGYGTLDKKQVTNSVVSLKSEDLMVGVGGADITSSLQGAISGVIFANNGSVNDGTTIQLRGMSSINAGKAPLVVIDGFPGGDIRSVSPNDILSVDVLKDASAGAIYGTRAASGVILITTKQGSNTDGKVRMTYSAEFRKRQSYNAPDLLSAEEYVKYGIGEDYGHDVDWWDELINHDNLSQRHELSLESGTKNAQFYMNFFYEDNQGIAIGDGREDYGGRVNANFKVLDDWLEIKPNISYRQAWRERGFVNFQQALRNNPTRSPYDPESETGYNVWTGNTLDYNMLADRKLSKDEGLDKWFKPEVTLKLNIKPIRGLSYQQVVGYENRQWERHYYRSKYHRSELEEKKTGTAELEFSKTENLTSEGYFNYIRDFDEGKHTLSAVGGYSYFEKNNEGFSMSNYNFDVDGIEFWNMGNGKAKDDGKAGISSSKAITERLLAYFARANYSYKDTYMLQASIRHEGSSKFGANHRWGTFWSASAGWRISNESFMKDISWIDDLKVRAAYGVTGNNDFDSSYMANMLGSDTYWMLPDGTWAYSYGKSQNINPNLGWEEKAEWDFGLDFSLFNNRVYGKFDYYIRTTDRLLYDMRVPQPPYPNGSQWQNIGEMESKGWEFDLGASIIDNKEFKWTSNINFSQNQSKIVNLAMANTTINGNGFPSPGDPGDAARIEAGSEIGKFFLWKFAGFDDNGDFLLYNKEGEVIPASEKTVNDKQYIGSYIPKLMIGWRNTFQYKDFDLGINMRSWIDFDVYNAVEMYFGLQTPESTNKLKSAYGKNAHITGEKQQTDYFLEDGTFLKVDAITLGYTLNMSKYTKLLNQIRVYGTVGNAFTITGYDGMDPEVNITGWAGGTENFWSGYYPTTRTYTLGLQVKF
ncbi:SusC/RagA family TonB-linked outer membrane protein [Dysgonomonas sp. Marseille-P4361]|uniref:SusC/RagA family TonB-linked outer membrane protein n=1 Tax=Dysgonomonas sp. Marseille-P4361 TaxID=2161820 RepID=UPI000D553D73|nr:SusC/RagA family TonB-linked outer membrane protein [Dysgonomonas sp. Marseille-P4361]